MKLGTYTTIDVPTRKSTEAKEFLKKEFAKIGGKVRVINNSHDLGDYPSYEIDYSGEVEIAICDLREDDEGTDLENCQDIVDNWHATARGIVNRFQERFNEYL